MTNLNAQKEFEGKVNLRNTKGQKEGLWKEEEETDTKFYTLTYYENGIKNGVYREYQFNKLFVLGEYIKGKMTGTWYYFGDYGHLTMIQKDFQTNTYQTPTMHHVQGLCPFRCYCIDYYPNGNKKSEGLLLWDEDPQSDFTFEYGEWKYYDENGKLMSTKIFK